MQILSVKRDALARDFSKGGPTVALGVAFVFVFFFCFLVTAPNPLAFQPPPTAASGDKLPLPPLQLFYKYWIIGNKNI